ncbi:MAG: thermonuclease family protein [Acetobacteraceae bacterium]|nr:MAG: thermonuclease family protein [Acetobacteraceae bacterium]
MRRRRIFRPAPSPRRWGTLLLGCTVVAGSLMLAVAMPGDLFGSAPRERLWTASAAEVRVVDGDALRLGDRILRLDGITVPDRGQARCPAVRGEDCAAGAAEALARLVQGEALECQIRGQDRHGRALGLCRAAGIDVNAALVGAGWALADGGGLASQEAAARQQSLGIWGPGVIRPDALRSRF